ncbi:Flp family type IVb pilin [Consotaella aegiceratis]|uniref:Flp family type IVb pilin n=1 Tax=Consotaella aegiceratis TaxID=3097961 RepID=UPI002F423B8A
MTWSKPRTLFWPREIAAFAANGCGATMIEYALLGGLLGIVAIGAQEMADPSADPSRPGVFAVASAKSH